MTTLELASRENRRLIEIRLTLPSGAATTPRQAIVAFTVYVGGEQVGLLEAQPSEIGLPMTLNAARSKQRSDDGYRLPDYLLPAILNVLPNNEEPLCLSIEQPAGYLPVVPWERLLKQRIVAPIVRLPYPTLHARPTQSGQAVVGSGSLFHISAGEAGRRSSERSIQLLCSAARQTRGVYHSASLR